jgi:hypothetical protein
MANEAPPEVIATLKKRRGKMAVFHEGLAMVKAKRELLLRMMANTNTTPADVNPLFSSAPFRKLL